MERSDRFTKGGNYPYISPTPGKIPVVAFNPWVSRKDSSWQEAPDNTFKVLSDCGFNTAVLHVPEENILPKAFRLARESGIVCILQQYRHSLNSVMETLVERFKDEPNLGAFELKDEPYCFTLGIKECPAPKLDWSENEIRDMYDIIRGIIEGDNLHIMVFMNLAYGVNKDYTNMMPYPEYLKKVQEAYKPAMWS